MAKKERAAGAEELRLVYMTMADLEEAKRVGTELLRARLVACINILGSINSLFWWEGKIQEEQEVAVIAKTQAACIPALVEKVKALHSYSCPCVVAMPLTEGNREFMDWIRAETEPGEGATTPG